METDWMSHPRRLTCAIQLHLTLRLWNLAWWPPDSIPAPGFWKELVTAFLYLEKRGKHHGCSVDLQVRGAYFQIPATFPVPSPFLRQICMNICHGCKRFISFKGGTTGSSVRPHSPAIQSPNVKQTCIDPPPDHGWNTPKCSGPTRAEVPIGCVQLENRAHRWTWSLTSKNKHQPSETRQRSSLITPRIGFFLLAVILHLLTSSPKACPGHQLPPWVTFCPKA